MGGRAWAPEEDLAVCKCPRHVAAFEVLGRRLGRTTEAVSIRKHRLMPLGIKQERWTRQQDAIIREWIAATDPILARLPERRRCAVAHRANVLRRRAATVSAHPSNPES